MSTIRAALEWLDQQPTATATVRAIADAFPGLGLTLLADLQCNGWVRVDRRGRIRFTAEGRDALAECDAGLFEEQP